MSDSTIYIIQDLYDSSQTLSFREILLDETKVLGTLYIPRICFQKVSFLNHRLPAKRNYELMLRLSQYFTVESLDASNLNTLDLSTFVKIDSENTLNSVDALKTDCYILSRYKKFLLDENIFDEATSSILEAANSLGRQDEILTFLSGMLQEDDAYLYYYLGSQPFLIYTGCDVCYHILDVFAEQFGSALRRQGYLVEYFDLSVQDFTESSCLIGKRYQAVIGFQSYMFSVKLEDNKTFLHDKMIGPKYNFVFDHPILFQNHLQAVPKNLTIFTPDRNYANFANTFFPVQAAFFPPGGIETNLPDSIDRCYDVSFIGTYYDLKQVVTDSLQNVPRQKRFLINRFWRILRSNPHLSGEKAFSLALQYYGIELFRDEFLAQFYEMRIYLLYLANYYRYQILKTLVTSGIQVDVFGSSWKQCDLKDNPNFIWHENDLSSEECLTVWQHSKIALNIMTWHKDAITERILNSMIQGAVVLTERNPYLEENFSEEKELLFYDLMHLEELPETVLHALHSPEYLAKISMHGIKKAKELHTWDYRAKEFCDLILEEKNTSDL